MKKILSATLILLCISSSVNASSNHGDFEGSPIVSVQSNGKELAVEDVPAINYKGRTMVPIYMLKQLGADVVWDDASYSVNVKTNDQIAINNNELNLLKDLYSWLSDTDKALRMYAENLPHYLEVDSPSSYSQFLELDFQSLTTQYTESLTLANQVKDTIKSENKINEIIASQAKTMDQLTKTKNLLQAWMVNSDSRILISFKQSIFSALQITQENCANTDSIKHALLLNNFKVSK